MAEIVCTIPLPKTPQELDQAIALYKTGEFDDYELFCQWQAIRDASIEQNPPEPEVNAIAGEDSY
jgi:hypothetical protein